jgi:pimeloyl-ACP methyl ester carboxylesterase
MLYNGVSGSLEDWLDLGNVDAFKDDYEVILIDSRGHGGSAGPREPESYSNELHVGDIVAVLNALKIVRTHYFGYSWGGWFGFGLLQFEPERLLSMVIGGMSPYKPSDEFIDALAAKFSDGIEAALALREEASGERLPEPRRSRCQMPSFNLWQEWSMVPRYLELI